jgi:hypothetical protein
VVSVDYVARFALVENREEIGARARELDQTGFLNVIVRPDLYEKYDVVINREKFLRVEGVQSRIRTTPNPSGFPFIKWE